MINVPKLFKEAIQLQIRDEPDSNIREDDVVLTQVKLKVLPGSCKWTELFQTDHQGACRTVNINNTNTAGPEAVGQVHTTSENQNVISISLGKGIVKGLNSTLKLPLDPGNKVLIAAFGTHIDIDPSKAFSEPIQNKMKIGVAVEGALGPRGATATIRNREKEYKGHFSCTVIMKGKGLARGGIERQIGDAINNLKRAKPGDADLAALKVVSEKGKNVVQFSMEGQMECKWGYEHTVDWK